MRRVVSERKKETAGEASAVTGITHQDKEEQSVESVKRNGKTCSRGFGREKRRRRKNYWHWGRSVIADYFVLASASNANQTQALVDNVEEKLSKPVMSVIRKREVWAPHGPYGLRRCDRTRILQGRPPVLWSGEDLERRKDRGVCGRAVGKIV